MLFVEVRRALEHVGRQTTCAAVESGLSRATGYRLLRRRFDELREGSSVESAAVTLRMSRKRFDLLERERQSRIRRDLNAATAALRKALAASGLVADLSVTMTRRGRKARNVEDEYWQLMRQGMSNTDACKLLGMPRGSGTWIRQRAGYRIPSLTPDRTGSRRTLPRSAGTAPDRRPPPPGTLDSPDQRPSGQAPLDDQPRTPTTPDGERGLLA